MRTRGEPRFRPIRLTFKKDQVFLLSSRLVDTLPTGRLECQERSLLPGDFMRDQAARTDTADRILDLAERLVQTRGFNGFSYADIASELGLTKASLHYHFPTKAELGRCL